MEAPALIVTVLEQVFLTTLVRVDVRATVVGAVPVEGERFDATMNACGGVLSDGSTSVGDRCKRHTGRGFPSADPADIFDGETARFGGDGGGFMGENEGE